MRQQLSSFSRSPTTAMLHDEETTPRRNEETRRKPSSEALIRNNKNHGSKRHIRHSNNNSKMTRRNSNSNDGSGSLLSPFRKKASYEALDLDNSLHGIMKAGLTPLESESSIQQQHQDLPPNKDLVKGLDDVLLLASTLHQNRKESGTTDNASALEEATAATMTTATTATSTTSGSGLPSWLDPKVGDMFAPNGSSGDFGDDEDDEDEDGLRYFPSSASAFADQDCKQNKNNNDEESIFAATWGPTTGTKSNKPTDDSDGFPSASSAFQDHTNNDEASIFAATWGPTEVSTAEAKTPDSALQNGDAWSVPTSSYNNASKPTNDSDDFEGSISNVSNQAELATSFPKASTKPHIDSELTQEDLHSFTSSPRFQPSKSLSYIDYKHDETSATEDSSFFASSSTNELVSSAQNATPMSTALQILAQADKSNSLEYDEDDPWEDNTVAGNLASHSPLAAAKTKVTETGAGKAAMQQRRLSLQNQNSSIRNQKNIVSKSKIRSASRGRRRSSFSSSSKGTHPRSHSSSRKIEQDPAHVSPTSPKSSKRRSSKSSSTKAGHKHSSKAQERGGTDQGKSIVSRLSKHASVVDEEGNENVSHDSPKSRSRKLKKSKSQATALSLEIPNNDDEETLKPKRTGTVPRRHSMTNADRSSSKVASLRKKREDLRKQYELKKSTATGHANIVNKAEMESMVLKMAKRIQSEDRLKDERDRVVRLKARKAKRSDSLRQLELSNSGNLQEMFP